MWSTSPMMHHLLILLTLISFSCTEEFKLGSKNYESHVENYRSLGRHQNYGINSDFDVTHNQNYEISANEEEGAVAEARGAEGCKFPSKWEGSWFQSGGGSDLAITITRSSINTKGRCLEADDEKYLIYSERESCYRCVVFHEKHFNVLQYKETFCVPERRSIRDFCSTISGDANLHAMFRLDAVPIECPFKGPFNFAYNRGQKECIYPASTVDPCISPTRVQLNFQACPDVPGSESRSEELLCLATWREGSSRFLLGLIKYNHPASYEERFRCFVYEKSKKSSFGNGSSADNVIFRLAQSGDATCNGLNLNEYSRMMTLRKAPSTKGCQFPSWLQSHAQWHTLDQRITFVFDSSIGLRMYNSSDISGISSNSLSTTANCFQILDNPTLSKVSLILHSTSECNSGFICSTIYRREGHIVEVQMGNTARKADDACHVHYFNQSSLPFITLISSTPETRQCPNVGRFQVTGLIKEGRKLGEGKCVNSFDSLSVGCNSLDRLQIRTDCFGSDMNADYACHGTWEEMGVSYLIVTPLTRPSSLSRRFCFIFREVTKQTTNFISTSPYKNSYNNYNQDHSPHLNSFENNRGRVFLFSTIGDSCRRNLIPGIQGAIAFNVSENGQCNDLNSSPINIPSYHNLIMVLTNALIIHFYVFL